MKKQLNRMVSAFLVLCLLGTMFPSTVFAINADSVSASAPFSQPEKADYEDGSSSSDSLPEQGQSSSSQQASQPEAGEQVKPTPTATNGETDNASSSCPASPMPEPTLTPAPTATLPVQAEPEKEKIPRAEWRVPILRSTYDAEEAKYGDPIAVSAYARVFSLGEKNNERQFKTVISSTPNTYVDGSGSEMPIDNTLMETSSQGEACYQNAANDLIMQAPAENSTDSKLSVLLNGQAVQLIPAEGDYSRPVTKENAVRYTEVFDGIDVQYTAKELFVKEDIILNCQVQKEEFRYLLNAPDFEAKMKDGVLNLYKPGETVATFTIAAPVMSDAAGNYSFAVKLSLETQGEQQYVVVKADHDWLVAPERVYPVLIDPTVINTKKAAASLFAVGRSFYEQGVNHAVAGYAYKTWAGYPADNYENWNITRTMLYFNDLFASLPNDFELDSAKLVLHEYEDLSNNATTFEVYQLNESRTYEQVCAYGDSGGHWPFVQNAPREFLGSFQSSAGNHEIDVTQTVNNWQKGITPNYGLMLMAQGENTTTLGARFYPGYGYEPDIAPYIELTWHLPGDVPSDYNLNNTTINLRPLNATDTKGKLNFYGVLWDGTATPRGSVSYQLNQTAKGYSGVAATDPDFIYPNTASFESLFPAGTTKYRRRLSNWQVVLPFTNPDYDTIYSLKVKAKKDAATGAEKTSETFLVYKVKQFDTLAKIAAYYGVDYDALAKDNRVVDGLLVENNTLFIRNPKTDKPYSAAPLTDEDKTKIDTLLVGRGLHCEFGFEPVNLNTGNFYLNTSDVTLQEPSGAFQIGRSYNSKTASQYSSFGRGWGFTYDESLALCQDGSLAYRRGDGSTVYFSPDGSGGFLSPQGLYLSLAQIPAGQKTVNFGTEEDPDIKTVEIIEYEITDANKTVKRFNAGGQLLFIRDQNGFKTEFAYDAQKLLSKITTPSGKELIVHENPNGTIAQIDLPNGASLSYQYDTDGNLTAFEDAMGQSTQYHYDEKHQMLNWVDANGTVIVTNVYDAEGRVVKQTDGEGKESLLAYTTGKTVTTDANGNKTAYTYDENYRTTRIDYPDGTTETFEYDAANNLAASTDKAGHRTEYLYDAAGRVAKQTRFDGLSQSFLYNEQGKPLQVVDYDGQETRYSYDGNGDLQKITFADGTASTFTYDTYHRLCSSTDAAGGTTTLVYQGFVLYQIVDARGGTYTFSYDAMGNVASTLDPKGNLSRVIYDAAGRVITKQAAGGATTQYTYDPAGRVIATTDPNGYRTEYTYDKADHRLTLTDPDGQVYHWTYDAVGNKLTEADPLGNQLHFTYDAMGRVLTATNAEGKVTTYEYNALGNTAAVTAPGGGRTAYTYDDRFGIVATVTDPLGGVTTTEYSATGQPVKTIYADGSTATTVYDGRGRVAQTTDQLGLVTNYTYDAVGNVQQKSDSMGRVTTMAYDKQGNMTQVQLPGGAQLAYGYDAMGQMTSLTDALSAVSTVGYTPAGLAEKVTNANGDSIRFQYDENGNVVAWVDAMGNQWDSTYNAMNLVTLKKDPLGGQTKYDYDAAGRLVTVWGAMGEKTRYELDGRGLPLKIIDAAGQETQMAYDDDGNLTAVTLPDGTVNSYTYDLKGQLLQTQDAQGLITSYTYDSMGRLVRTENNAGQTTRYTYNAAGQLLAQTDALGQKTLYQYDAAGNLVAVQGYDGNTTKYAYDATGNVIEKTDAQNKKTSYLYDAAGNLLQSEDAALRVWAYVYDHTGQLVKTTDPVGATTDYTYNANGNLIKQVDAQGGVLSFAYDALGQITEAVDENGNKTQVQYDASGNVTRQVQADGGEYQFLYDVLGRLQKQRDPMGQVTGYSYDKVGNLTAKVLPSGAVYQYTYTNNGALSSQTDPMGSVTTWATDLLGRPTQKTLPNGAQYSYTYDEIGRITALAGPQGQSAMYTYDAKGNLAQQQDSLGRLTRYTYDQMHRLTQVTDPKLGVTALSYDESGNLAKVLSPGGKAESYQYDALDRLTQKTDPAGAVTSYIYDTLGRLTETVEPQGRSTARAYDAAGNLVSVTDALGGKTSFAYDSMNRLLQYTDAAGAATTYQYDLNGNLTQMQNAVGNKVKYAYDEVGNRISQQDATGKTTQYTYDLLGRMISTTDGLGATTLYGYDTVGNLTQVTNALGAVQTYQYDLAGQLVKSTDAAGNTKTNTWDAAGNLKKTTLPSGKTIEYNYDELDALINKTATGEQGDAAYSYNVDGSLVTMQDASGTSSYTYDTAGRLVSATNGAGAMVRYTYNENSEIASVTYPDGKSVQYSYDKLGRVCGVTGRDGGKATYTYDAQGNPVCVTRADGSVTQSTYNRLGQLVTLVNKNEAGQVLSSYRYRYDANGYVAAEDAQLGEDEPVHSAYTYNARGELVSVNQGGNVTSYTYDAAGNRIKKQDAQGDTLYLYDSVSRLLQSTGPDDAVTTYQWDKDGNMVKQQTPTDTKTYEYTAESRLKAVRSGGTLLLSVLYDGMGERAFALRATQVNQVNWHTVRKAGHWAAGTLASQNETPTNAGQQAQPEATPGQQTPQQGQAANTVPQKKGLSVFWYAFGVVLLRFFAGADQLWANEACNQYTQWWYDQAGIARVTYTQTTKQQLLQQGYTEKDIALMQNAGVSETDAKQAAAPVWVPGEQTAESTTGLATVYDPQYYANDVLAKNTQVLTLSSQYYGDESYTYGLQRLYSDSTQGQNETYLYDGQGSVAQVLQKLAVSSTLYYDEYGNPTQSGAAGTGSYFGYNGEEHDPLTGLQYLRARYYNPATGSFISKDSFAGILTVALSQNGYTYAHNNPLNYADPSGNVAAVLGFGFGALIAKAAAAAGSAIAAAVASPVAVVAAAVVVVGLGGYLVYKVYKNYQATQAIAPAPAPRPRVTTFPAPAAKKPRVTTFPSVGPQLPSTYTFPGGSSYVPGSNIYSTPYNQGGTGNLTLFPQSVEKSLQESILYARRLACEASEAPHITPQEEAERDIKFGIPDYVKDNRVPQDKETILNSKDYQKTGKQVKGAQVYKNGDKYYYRDTFHTGESSHLEVFDKRGNHLGEADPITGALKPGTVDSTKTINVK